MKTKILIATTIIALTLAVVAFTQQKPVGSGVVIHQHCDVGQVTASQLDAARQTILDQGCREIHEYHMVNDEWYVYGTSMEYVQLGRLAEQ